MGWRSYTCKEAFANVVEGTNKERNASLDELINLPQLTILKTDIEDVNCLPRNVNFIPRREKFDIFITRSLFSRLMNVHPVEIEKGTYKDHVHRHYNEHLTRLVLWGCERESRDVYLFMVPLSHGYPCSIWEGKVVWFEVHFVEQCHSVQCLILLAHGIYEPDMCWPITTRFLWKTWILGDATV